MDLTHPCEQPEHKFMCVPAQPVPVMIHDSEMLHVEIFPHCLLVTHVQISLSYKVRMVILETAKVGTDF